MPDRIWNAAEYTRLSRDDGDKAESNSITSQKEIIRDYVRRYPEFVIVKEYADATVIIGLPLRLHPQRKGYFEVGNDPHHQHERRRKIR